MLCTECGKIVEAIRAETVQEIEVKGEFVQSKIVTLTCPECGEEIYDRETEIQNDIRVFDEYKKLMNLLTVSEIKEIRNKYGLSADKFSLLLGFGEKTVWRYEQGSIQDYAHDNLMRLMADECVFFTHWELRKNVLDRFTNNKIMKIISRQRIFCDEISSYTTKGYCIIGDAESADYSAYERVCC